MICLLCNKQFKKITNTHLKKHNISIKEYKKMFPDALIETEKQKMSRYTEKARQKNSKKLELKWQNKDYREHQIKTHSKPYENGRISGMKGKKHSEQSKQQMKKTKNDPQWKQEFCKLMREICGSRKWRDVMKINVWNNIVVNKKISDKLIKRWREDKEFRRCVWNVFNTTIPNKTEIKIDKLFQKYFPNTFTFVGDGKFFIGSRCPDWINEERKIIIEFFGAYWHNPEDEIEKINYYKKYGWQTLVIWDYEKKDKILTKIKRFLLTISKDHNSDNQQPSQRNLEGSETKDIKSNFYVRPRHPKSYFG